MTIDAPALPPVNGNATKTVSLVWSSYSTSASASAVFFDDAPHHRLRAAVEQAVGGEFHDFAGDLRLGRIAHGQIGVIPIARTAEALEFVALHIHPMFGKGAALAAELDNRHVVLVLALGAIFLFDLPFDRQAVAIPARHVVRVVAEHLLRAGDQIFQDLVERMADMDIAIGIGRPVVQDEFRPAGGSLAQQAVEVDLGPTRQDLRLLFGQAGAHRKIRQRQIERFRVIRGLLFGDLLIRRGIGSFAGRMFVHNVSGLILHGGAKPRFGFVFSGRTRSPQEALKRGPGP